MNREEYDEKVKRNIENTIFSLLDKTCRNCMFYNNSREKCYKLKIVKDWIDRINQCEDWESEGWA
jgi:hypothetical protein